MSEGPQKLSDVLSKLIAMRGYARREADAQLHGLWSVVAGELWAGQTRAMAIKRGVLHVDVAHSALLSELTAFHRGALLKKLQELYPHLDVRDLKFKLASRLRKPPPGP